MIVLTGAGRGGCIAGIVGAGGVEKADVSRLERGLLLPLAYRACAFFLDHEKPGRLGLDAYQFAGAADPLRVSFDMHKIEAWHMCEWDWLGMDGACRCGMGS
jgi:hypothetical protein